MFILISILSLICWAMLGWKVALTIFVGFFFYGVALSFGKETYRMFKYREEYMACSEAVLADSEEMADDVNQWSRNYYVHKDFYLSANKSSIKCGNRLSVRSRPQRNIWTG